MLPQLNWLTGLQEYSVFCFHKVLYWIIHVFDYLKVLLTISSNILKIKNKVFRIMHTIKISLIKQSNLQSFVNIRIKMWRKIKNTIIGETYLNVKYKYLIYSTQSIWHLNFIQERHDAAELVIGQQVFLLAPPLPGPTKFLQPICRQLIAILQLFVYLIHCSYQMTQNSFLSMKSVASDGFLNSW